MQSRLIRQPPRVNILLGENDHHRSAANFAIIVHFSRHLTGMRDDHFEDFETSRAGDAGVIHETVSHRERTFPSLHVNSVSLQALPALPF